MGARGSGAMRANGLRRGERVVTVLDIGTAKICCLIVALVADPEHSGGALGVGEQGRLPARLLGFGHQRSQGIKAGVVVDLDAAEREIRATVAKAERAAGVTVDEVVISVSCGRVRSRNFSASAPVGGRTVSDGDIERVRAAGRSFAEADGRKVLHLFEIGYGLDGVGGIREPRGLAGRELSVDLHAVTVDESPLRNLLLLVERCHLTVSGLVAAPYASGLAAVTREEARLGVACLDLGAGTTTLSVFAEGHFVYSDIIAIGGNHITFDIARALSTPLYEAERIKTLYGSLVHASSDAHESISYPVVGEDEVSLWHTSKEEIGALVRARVANMLEVMRDRLEESGFGPYAGERVVLTGGASLLAGLEPFAAGLLGRTVRIGAPRPIGAMPSSLAGPAFSTVIGLLHALLVPGASVMAYADRKVLRAGAGYWSDVRAWLTESF